jgi:arylsulfatase A-like enzyme
MASAQEAHSKREVTTSPLQSLALINSDVVFEWSQALAGRVINEAGNDEQAQLDRLYQILFSRKASDTEKETLQKFLNNHEKVVREKTSEGKFAVSIPTGLKDNKKLDPIRAAAFVDLVHTVTNSNEFIYRF